MTITEVITQSAVLYETLARNAREAAGRYHPKAPEHAAYREQDRWLSWHAANLAELAQVSEVPGQEVAADLANAIATYAKSLDAAGPHRYRKAVEGFVANLETLLAAACAEPVVEPLPAPAGAGLLEVITQVRAWDEGDAEILLDAMRIQFAWAGHLATVSDIREECEQAGVAFTDELAERVRETSDWVHHLSDGAAMETSGWVRSALDKSVESMART